jgi:hypothetical protein
MQPFWCTATVDSANADVDEPGTAKQPKSDTAFIWEDAVKEVLTRAEGSTTDTQSAF